MSGESSLRTKLEAWEAGLRQILRDISEFEKVYRETAKYIPRGYKPIEWMLFVDVPKRIRDLGIKEEIE